MPPKEKTIINQVVRNKIIEKMAGSGGNFGNQRGGEGISGGGGACGGNSFAKIM